MSASCSGISGTSWARQWATTPSSTRSPTSSAPAVSLRSSILYSTFRRASRRSNDSPAASNSARSSFGSRTDDRGRRAVHGAGAGADSRGIHFGEDARVPPLRSVDDSPRDRGWFVRPRLREAAGLVDLRKVSEERDL